MKDIILEIVSILFALFSIVIVIYSQFINQRNLKKVKTQYQTLLSSLSNQNLKFSQLIEDKTSSDLDEKSLQTIRKLLEIWTNYKSLESSSEIYSEIFLPYVESKELKFIKLISFPLENSNDFLSSFDFYKESIKYLLTTGKGFTIVNEVLKNDLKFKSVNNENFENRLNYESLLVIPISDFYSNEEHKPTVGIFVSGSKQKNAFRNEDFDIIHSITHNISKYLSKVNIDYKELSKGE